MTIKPSSHGWHERNFSYADKPGPASISYEPRRVVKKGPLNITCSVKDPGRPVAMGFKWFRGPVRLSEENQAVYQVDKARLENRENFTCMAYNEAGDGDPASAFVNISGNYCNILFA